MPFGAASRKIRPESRSSDHAARSITAATNSDAMPSARSHPVTQDQQARHRGGDERHEVGQHVLEGALDVQRRAVRAVQDDRGDEVHRHADQGDDEHDAALDRGRVDQPADALVDDQQPEHEQRRAVELGGEDLGALEAVGHRALGRPRRQPQRDQRQRERGRVGEHVRGVGEQRQRLGEDAGHDLDGHQAEQQAERDPQPPGRGVGRRVRMPVVVVVAHDFHDERRR